MSRRNQTAELKRRIMDAALVRFSQEGIERTNIGDILEDADCSVGSFYHHFGNKEGIVEAVFMTGFERFNRELLEALLSRRTAATGIRAIVTYLCRFATGQPQLAAYVLSREIKLSKSARQELAEMDRALFEELNRWFTPHIDSGDLKRLPPALYMPLITGPTFEYARMWLSKRNRQSPAQVSDLLAEAAWQSIRGEDR